MKITNPADLPVTLGLQQSNGQVPRAAAAISRVPSDASTEQAGAQESSQANLASEAMEATGQGWGNWSARGWSSKEGQWESSSSEKGKPACQTEQDNKWYDWDGRVKGPGQEWQGNYYSWPKAPNWREWHDQVQNDASGVRPCRPAAVQGPNSELLEVQGPRSTYHLAQASAPAPAPAPATALVPKLDAAMEAAPATEATLEAPPALPAPEAVANQPGTGKEEEEPSDPHLLDMDVRSPADLAAPGGSTGEVPAALLHKNYPGLAPSTQPALPANLAAARQDNLTAKHDADAPQPEAPTPWQRLMPAQGAFVHLIPGCMNLEPDEERPQEALHPVFPKPCPFQIPGPPVGEPPNAMPPANLEAARPNNVDAAIGDGAPVNMLLAPPIQFQFAGSQVDEQLNAVPFDAQLPVLDCKAHPPAEPHTPFEGSLVAKHPQQPNFAAQLATLRGVPAAPAQLPKPGPVLPPPPPPPPAQPAAAKAFQQAQARKPPKPPSPPRSVQPQIEQPRVVPPRVVQQQVVQPQLQQQQVVQPQPAPRTPPWRETKHVFVDQQDFEGNAVKLACTAMEHAWCHSSSWGHLLKELPAEQQQAAEKVVSLLKVPVPNIVNGVRQNDGHSPDKVNTPLNKKHLMWAESQWNKNTGLNAQESLGIMAPVAAAFTSEFLCLRGLGQVLNGKQWRKSSRGALSEDQFLVLELPLGNPAGLPKYQDRDLNEEDLPADTAYGFHGSSMYALAAMLHDGIKAFDTSEGPFVYCFEEKKMCKTLHYGDNLSLGPSWPFLIKPVYCILMDKSSACYRNSRDSQQLLQQPICQQEDLHSILIVVNSVCKYKDGGFSGLGTYGNIKVSESLMPWFHCPSEACWNAMVQPSMKRQEGPFKQEQQHSAEHSSEDEEHIFQSRKKKQPPVGPKRQRQSDCSTNHGNDSASASFMEFGLPLQASWS